MHIQIQSLWTHHGLVDPCCLPIGRDVAAAPQTTLAHWALTSCACSAPQGSCGRGCHLPPPLGSESFLKRRWRNISIRDCRHIERKLHLLYLCINIMLYIRLSFKLVIKKMTPFSSKFTVSMSWMWGICPRHMLKFKLAPKGSNRSHCVSDCSIHTNSGIG